MEKYLYFRSAAAAADDDDAAAGSNLYRASALRGAEATSDTTFTMYFDGKVNFHGDGTANVDNLADTVVVTLTTANNFKTVFRKLIEEIEFGRSPFIVVADDGASEYVHSDIASVGDFAVAAAQA